MQGGLNFGVINSLGAYFSLTGIGILYAITGSLQLPLLAKSVDEHGRCAEAVENVEWTERKAPALLAVGGERDQAEVLEEGVHALAVGHR